MTDGSARSPHTRSRPDRHRRAVYASAAVVLLLIEIAIAMIVKSGFIRHTLGDVLVVMLLYGALMAVTRLKPIAASLLCTSFAIAVEGAQALNIVDRLGLGDVVLARIAIGATFSQWDIVAYAAGGASAVLIDALARNALPPSGAPTTSP